MKRFQAPRGTHDVLPGPADPRQDADLRIFRSHKWQALEATFRDVCARFGVTEIRTPLFEETDLFRRSTGAESDIVTKEMYDFIDRGGRQYTLRPEGTPPVMRALVEHHLLSGQNQLVKVYYIASIFRYERAQRGRYRQHHQVGVEYVGGDGPEVDVEVIALGMTYLRELGLSGLSLQINSIGTTASRAAYREALRDHFRPHLDKLSEDSRRRFETNPLRILDSKDPRDQPFLAEAPLMLDHLPPDEADHFAAVQEGLTELGIPFVVNGRIVRGLDYYQKTTFEVVAEGLGSQNVILGGGRYDGMVAELGGPPVGGVGFGSGIERALLSLEQAGRPPGDEPAPQIYVIARSDPERREARRLTMTLRCAGLRAEVDLLGRSMKAQLRAADAARCPLAVFVREDLPDAYRLKVLAATPEGAAPELTVPRATLLETVRECLATRATEGAGGASSPTG